MRLLVICVLLFASAAVPAANFSVTTTANSGVGSLRQALIDANNLGGGPHIIIFDPSYPQFGTITLASSLPVITATDVRIRGSDRSPVINGANTYAIFRAAKDVSLELEDLNMHQGRNDSGGCVATDTPAGTGSLLIERSYFYQCIASTGSFPGGGAVYWNADSPAQLTINDSAFFENQAISSNTATEQPRGGAVESSANTILRRNVFKDNTTSSAGDRGGYGGAVSLYMPDPNGVSEISDNRFESNITDPATTFLGTGGAVRAYLVPGAQIFVERNFFLDNQARQGGALSLATQASSTTTQATLINNTFVENDSTLDGGAVRFNDLQLFANHNTFYNNSGASGSHLSFERVQMRTLENNVLAATSINPACSIVNSSIVSASLAGNFFYEACDILSSSGGTVTTNLEVQVVDTGPRVGVAIFVAGADPIDGGSSSPSICNATDAQGTPRPLDGDDDGIAICDAGAYEAPSDIVFEDGFET